ncbi:hypothetical protein FLA105534_01902 [Flavobacterium bizetiae]|uniref:Uncharacterized protein n=1 Tax=Flavobacterium bizetiae TaxID=2704140 RepID=A0A6J4GI26_9FLAO|nr:hypothetical protein FLA105534_01902 [Flavobacterium bizetiae]
MFSLLEIGMSFITNEVPKALFALEADNFEAVRKTIFLNSFKLKSVVVCPGSCFKTSSSEKACTLLIAFVPKVSSEYFLSLLAVTTTSLRRSVLSSKKTVIKFSLFFKAMLDSIFPNIEKFSTISSR